MNEREMDNALSRLLNGEHNTHEQIKEIVALALKGARCSEAVQRWIPLREKMPDGQGDVLAYHSALGPHGHGVVIRPIDVVRHWAIHKDDQSMIGAYWMPLPSAPDSAVEE